MTIESKREIQTFLEAILEARRCLQCPRPLCQTGCPIENDIPAFNRALAKGNIGEAMDVISKRSNLPAICGRVCPHEEQCEGNCVLAKKGEAIRIGELERFIADMGNDLIAENLKISKREDKIAIIGAGPAGITVAGDLALLGFSVTVFESQVEPGGVLMYGIPGFRLSKDIVRREIEKLVKLGVEIRTEVSVGKDITIDEIFSQGFAAVFIGTGTDSSSILNIPGKDLPGVATAMNLLTSVALSNSGHLSAEEVPVQTGDKVIVVGGGNVAIDAARTAVRLGAEHVRIVYRRTMNEMPAFRSEYEHAVAEGVEFSWLTNPVAYSGNGYLTAVEVQKMALDESGKPVPTDETFEIAVDKLFLAVGQKPSTDIMETIHGIETDKSGCLITREHPYGMTGCKGVFACGDVVHGPATVVLAMKEGKKVAKSIAAYIDAVKLVAEL
jgi:NADPH-dependent glutamate synthase beta chain and related oxidoreductases